MANAFAERTETPRGDGLIKDVEFCIGMPDIAFRLRLFIELSGILALAAYYSITSPGAAAAPLATDHTNDLARGSFSVLGQNESSRSLIPSLRLSATSEI